MTITYLLFFINKQVEFLNSVFSKIKFYDAAKENFYTGLKFLIHRTKIISFSECNATDSNLTRADLDLCLPNLDVYTLLNKVAFDDYNDYCLGFAFTARDFNDGTLGLAWLAEQNNEIGGICQNKSYRRPKYYNTGLITTKNYKSHVPDVAAQLAFAHEVGHSFGSEHDPMDSKCSPGNANGGNYLMYRRSNRGIYKNNRFFSQCSISQMGPILHSIIRNPTKFCFKQFDGPLCGNGVLEKGEECDCGFKEDCKYNCCYSASEADESKRCKLKPAAKCSPSQGICCNENCEFKNASTICRKVIVRLFEAKIY